VLRGSPVVLSPTAKEELRHNYALIPRKNLCQLGRGIGLGYGRRGSARVGMEDAPTLVATFVSRSCGVDGSYARLRVVGTQQSQARIRRRRGYRCTIRGNRQGRHEVGN
jgi:hypothetical protein